MSTWTIKEKSCGELVITVENEAWKNAQEKAFNKISEGIQIEGFRKGKAPKKLIEKQVSKQSVLVEAAEIGAQAALEQGISENDLWLIARPELAIEELTEEKVVYRFTCTIKPEVTLGEYKGLKYEVAQTSVTAEEVEEKLKQLQEKFTELVVKEGTVENGDTAVIDFEGFKDGVAFDGGKGENYPLEIGSGSFIPGFEEQVVGMSVSETKDIEVSFPENYQAEELAGAPVVFKVTVNEIKTRQLPELNDDFAKDVNMENVETLEQLKAKVEEQVKTEKETAAKNEATEALLTTLVSNASVEIPEVMIDSECGQMINEYANRLQSQGLNFDQFLQITGQTVETMKEQMHEEAERRVNLRLVLEQIASQEKLSASLEEIESEYNEIAAMYSMEVEKVKELISSDNIQYDLQLRKAMDFVKDTAK